MVEEVKVRTYFATYYNNRIKSDPEFYENEKKRVKDYVVNRYNTDEEYKKKIRENNLRNYYKKKELLKAQLVN